MFEISDVDIDDPFLVITVSFPDMILLFSWFDVARGIATYFDKNLEKYIAPH